MIGAPELLLVGTVAAVGVLHTVVPDHWVPITLIARQRGWSTGEVARAAAIAGTGHTVSTLLIGLCVWLAGVAFATKFGNLVSSVSGVALVGFGLWVTFTSLRELRTAGGHGHSHGELPELEEHSRTEPTDVHALRVPHKHRPEVEPAHDHGRHPERAPALDHDHDQDREHEHAHERDLAGGGHPRDPGGVAVMLRHTHVHRHGASTVHAHVHGHGADTRHAMAAVDPSDPPMHEHRHDRSSRTTLLLILGSSPMVEGVPAFFAAAKYGPTLMAVMAVVFATATIGTYVALSVSSVAGLQRVDLGPLERYGEVLSGAFIATVGLACLIFPVF